jgi:hypothetical protein
MKVPPGMSKTVTHRLTICDRSEAGTVAVNRILDIARVADERIAPWRTSTDRFFVFVFEEESGRIGSVAAKDLDHLLNIVQELFDTHLLPPANPTFDILVASTDNKTVYDHTAKLLLATVVALETGVRP